MDDEAHVRLVDPHPESVGSHHHLDPVEEEVLLILLPLLRLQPGVVAGCGDAGALEELADLLHVLPGGAVDDAALPRPLPHPGQQLHPLYGGVAHLQIQVVPVKPGGDGQGGLQLQQPLDILPDLRGGGGGEGPHHRPLGQPVHKVRDVQIGGAEVLPPLGDTVGLVHCHHGDLGRADKGLEPLGIQPLRSHIDDLVPALPGPVQGQQILPVGERAVEVGGGHSHLHQLGHLVPHEGDQRGDHQGDAGQQQGRHLIAHRFPRSRGHDGQHIPPGQQCVDDLLLTAPEGVIAEILLQNILLCHSRSPLFPAKHTPGAALRGMCVPLGSFLQVGHLKPAPRPSGALPACQFKKSFRFLEREG